MSFRGSKYVQLSPKISNFPPNVNSFKDSYLNCGQSYNYIRSDPGIASSKNNEQTLHEASELNIEGARTKVDLHFCETSFKQLSIRFLMSFHSAL